MHVYVRNRSAGTNVYVQYIILFPFMYHFLTGPQKTPAVFTGNRAAKAPFSASGSAPFHAEAPSLLLQKTASFSSAIDNENRPLYNSNWFNLFEHSPEPGVLRGVRVFCGRCVFVPYRPARRRRQRSAGKAFFGRDPGRDTIMIYRRYYGTRTHMVEKAAAPDPV